LLQTAVLWILNMSDGEHSVEEIAELSSIEVPVLLLASERLIKCGLLRDPT
jgi:aminopeptidase-like protein